MTRSFSILHLSDLHFDHANQQDRAIVIHALLSDIDQLRSQGHQFDLLVFSGDLVQAGAEAKNFAQVTDAFITPVLGASGLARDRLIIAAGNHDIDAGEAAAFVDTGLRGELTSVEKINDFIDLAIGHPSASHVVAALSRIQHFSDFVDSLKLAPFVTRNTFLSTQIYEIRGVRIGVAALNSAWRATGRHGDKNHLIIGERVVDIAIRDLSQADVKICVFHHPTDWLLEADAVAIENRIFSTFDLVCTGHVHRAVPMLIQRVQGTAVFSQAGTLYASRKYFNGYQVVQWDEVGRRVDFTCRSYFNDRRAFGPAENVMQGGRMTLSLGARPTSTNLSEVELFLRQARPLVRAKANDHISFTKADPDDASDDIGEVFVCPPLSRHRRGAEKIETETFETLATHVEPTTLLRSKDHIVFVGDPESGRTSLLHFLAVQVAQGVGDQPRVPVVLSASLVSQLRDYERAIRNYFSDADFPPPTAKAIRTLPWIVFLDDYDASKPGHTELLTGIAQRFPSHRMVIMTNAASVVQCDAVLGAQCIPIEIGYLPRRSIRQLSRVRYKGGAHGGLDDAAYQVVMQHISTAKLPKTGFIVTLVLWAAEKQKLRSDLNEAVLIENLISFLLGKTRMEAALRDVFDPRAQEFLLRAIAVELRTAGGWLESNKLLAFVLDYFQARGLRFGARQVLDQFIGCRLLVEEDGYISFRYPCYQDYFVALDLLREQNKFGELVAAAPDVLLSYGRELDLWSSLAREFRGLDKALLTIARGGQIKAALHDASEVSFTGSELGFKPARAREILANKPTKDQIDQLLDQSDEPITSSKRPPNTKPDAARDLGRLSEFFSQRKALELLSHIVRNADHERLETKRAVSLELLQLLSAHIFAMLDSFATFIDSRRDDIKGKTPLTDGDINKLLNTFRILISAGDIGRFSRLLSVDALRTSLQEFAQDESLKEGVRILAAMSASNNWDRDGIRLVDSVLKSLRSDLLRRTILLNMTHDLVFERYRPATVDAFAEAIAELEISLGHPKSSKGARVKELRGVVDSE